MLELRDLHIKFHDADHEAVRGINLTVNSGEIVGLVGESGSGKTVTAMVISSLMPGNKAAITGQVFLDGEDLLQLDEKAMRKKQGSDISVVFQEPMTAMNPVMRIGPQVEESLRVHTDLSREERKARALQALRDVDLDHVEELYDKFPHQLSGGMLQRVMIAAAIVSSPKLLLADEPTTALDVTIQHQIIRLLNQLKKELHMSVILVTHDLGVVRQMCDTVAVMYAGYIVETGACSEVLDNPAHPYTTGLIRSLPKDKDTRARLESIQGLPPDLSEEIVGCPFAPRCSRCTELCQREMPAVHDLGGGRSVRCHHAEAVKRGDDTNV